jgi:hypothetical protein
MKSRVLEGGDIFLLNVRLSPNFHGMLLSSNACFYMEAISKRRPVLSFDDILELATVTVLPHRTSENGSVSEVLWFETSGKMDNPKYQTMRLL